MSLPGTTRTFTFTCRDANGALFAPTTGLFETGPVGEPATLQVNLSGMTNPSTGVYKTAYAPVVAARHWWRWTITDSGGNKHRSGDYYNVDKEIG